MLTKFEKKSNCVYVQDRLLFSSTLPKMYKTKIFTFIFLVILKVNSFLFNTIFKKK